LVPDRDRGAVAAALDREARQGQASYGAGSVRPDRRSGTQPDRADRRAASIMRRAPPWRTMTEAGQQTFGNVCSATAPHKTKHPDVRVLANE